MPFKVLANWLYGIQIFITMMDESRFLIFQDKTFRTACLPRDDCGQATMRIYVIQTGPSPMLVDHHRDIKIGYYYHHPDGNKTQYFLTVNEDDDYKVSATTDFDEALLLHMTIENSLEFELFDPITELYLHALEAADCSVGTLALVDEDDPLRNISSFKIYTNTDKYFTKTLACC